MVNQMDDGSEWAGVWGFLCLIFCQATFLCVVTSDNTWSQKAKESYYWGTGIVMAIIFIGGAIIATKWSFIVLIIVICTYIGTTLAVVDKKTK